MKRRLIWMFLFLFASALFAGTAQRAEQRPMVAKTEATRLHSTENQACHRNNWPSDAS